MEIVEKKNQEILDNQKLRIIEFLRQKGILLPDHTKFLIKYSDDRKNFDIVELIQEMMNKSENYPFRDMLGKVKQFHSTFEIQTEDKPNFPDGKVQIMRLSLLYEEMRETIAAYAGGKEDMSLVEGYDGLIDSLYILLGTFDTYGMEEIMVKGFMAVHDSNMTKLDKDGKPTYRKEDGKVIKGPNYEPPTERLQEILTKEQNNNE